MGNILISEAYVGVQKVFPSEEHDYSQDYFTAVIKSNGTIKFSGATANHRLSYSKNEGETWSNPNRSIDIVVSEGDRVLFKGVNSAPNQNYGIGFFSTTSYFDVEGNIMSLLNGDNFKNGTLLDYSFVNLFKNNSFLQSAKNLVLPNNATIKCYSGMFQNCRNLTTAPELPATTLTNYCYANMFQNCRNLTTAPELPATTLANYCYANMFTECDSLITAPELPATVLMEGCYSSMFKGCDSLITPPQLLAETLTKYCYSNMFYECINLTTAPELLTTTLADYCYEYMFANCAKLTSAPSILPATILAKGCYQNMFYNCNALTKAPELQAETLVEECYKEMFRDCEFIEYIKCLATDISASNCTTNWLSGVAASGTFIKNSSMTSWTRDTNGIPTNWTVEDA